MLSQETLRFVEGIHTEDPSRFSTAILGIRGGYTAVCSFALTLGLRVKFSGIDFVHSSG
jgi:hypothetical protein